MGLRERSVIDPRAVFVEPYGWLGLVFKRLKLFKSPTDFRLIVRDLLRQVDLLEKLRAITFALHVRGVEAKESDSADRKSILFQDRSGKQSFEGAPVLVRFSRAIDQEQPHTSSAFGHQNIGSGHAIAASKVTP